MKYKRKGNIKHKSETTRTTWVYKPSLWELKFLKRRKRNIRGYNVK